ncbi:Mannosyl-oligosaccharide 1,2-alpha-mannosidase IB, partial [Cladochytrium tenue]
MAPPIGTSQDDAPATAPAAVAVAAVASVVALLAARLLARGFCRHRPARLATAATFAAAATATVVFVLALGGLTLLLLWLLYPSGGHQAQPALAPGTAPQAAGGVPGVPIPLDAGAGGAGVGSSSDTRAENGGTGGTGADEAKMEFVRAMMRHAWSGYERHAWGADDLRPLTRTGFDWYAPGTLLNTAVDALSTLWMMGMRAEYARAKTAVLARFLGPGDGDSGDSSGGGDFTELGAWASVFETTIRVLAGLLSAYELDGDPRLLAAARVVADALHPALGAADDGVLPLNRVNMSDGRAADPFGGTQLVFLAQAGSLQLELQYLADVTGEPAYAEKAFAQHVVQETPDGHVFIPDVRTYGHLNLAPEATFGHLTCFAGGMFALGADRTCAARHIDSSKAAATSAGECRSRELRLGRRLTATCAAAAFLPAAAGVGFEAAGLGAPGTPPAAVYAAIRRASAAAAAGGGSDGSDGRKAAVLPTLQLHERRYGLRPEIAESLFYLWRITGDAEYRERGWALAQA